ncbi:MAG: response regulator [Ginsengibacter sp.]
MSQKLNCIMIIDDDEPTNFLSNMIIEEAQCTHHIQIEDGGKKAINYLANSIKFTHTNNEYPWPDLIFLDINMPAMNGWEFLLKYNRLEKQHMGKVIMVMLTTSLDPDDEIKSKNTAGVTDFKHKPLTEQMVEEILQKYFPDCFRTPADANKSGSTKKSTG